MPRVEASLTRLVAPDSRTRRAGLVLGRLTQLALIGRLAARAARAPARMRPVSVPLTRFHGRLLQRTRGRLRRSWLFAAGQPVLALTTTGRRTGRPRTTAVACFAHGEDLALAGMALGAPRDPAWALNLEANPAATIDVGGVTVPVSARRATGADARQLWRRWVQLQPSAEAFRALAGREIPMFVLTRRAS